MKTHIFKLIFFSIFVGFIFITFTKNSNQGLKSSDLKDFPALKIGDLVFREGIGYDSLVIKELSQSPLTHIGIVASLEPLLILHASADGNDEKEFKVKLESLENFLALSKDIAIKRLKLDDTSLHNIVNLAKEKINFKFVLSSDDKRLYCTTLLEDAIAPYLPLNLPYEYVNFVFFEGKYLFPKAFFDDESSVLIYKYKKD